MSENTTIHIQIPVEIKDHYSKIAKRAHVSFGSVIRRVLFEQAGVEMADILDFVSIEKKERRQRLLDMRESGMTLEAIAKSEGVTRERIRQIIGNTGYVAWEMQNRESLELVPSLKDFTNSEIKDIILTTKARKARGKTRHAIGGDGSAANGMKWEEWVSQKLNSNNISHTMMPFHHEYDVTVGKSIKIEVKSSAMRADLLPSQNATSPTYQFNIGKKRRADFYILVTQTEALAFIVPVSDVPTAGTMRISYPSHRRTKYAKYLERWDILQEALNKEE